MSSLWPPREAAQVDYERLREIVLRGAEPELESLLRFERLGLAGLMARPGAESVWSASVSGARRAPWSPQQDPRQQLLAMAFDWLLAAGLPAAGWTSEEFNR